MADENVIGLVKRIVNIESSISKILRMITTPNRNGWKPDSNTWVYVSATSFKVVGIDLSSIFTYGTKLRCKQGGGYKYFYVVSSSFSTDTTVTITGEGTYTLSNATITDNYYSYADYPVSYPDWLIHAFTGWKYDPDTWVYVSSTSFKIVGKDVTSKFGFGTKLKLFQGVAYSYFYVVSSSFGSDTTVVVASDGNYTIANTAITNNYYSYSDFPQGYPDFLIHVDTGWRFDTDTWVYVSASSFKISGVDVTAKFQTGAKLRCKQGGAYKYFYVVSAAFGADTTVTVTGGTDYTVANATITDNYYSYDATPQGFPQWFNYTPTWTASISNPAIVDGTIVGKFCVRGRSCAVIITVTMGASTTYGNGNYSFTVPINSANWSGDVSNTAYLGLCHIRRPGNSNYTRLVAMGQNTGTLTSIQDITNGTNVNNLTPTSPITFQNADYIRISVEYQI